MGQFLQSSDRPRLAVAIALRRRVSRGPLHSDHPENAYRDAQLATFRAPREMMADVLEFGLDFLLAEQAEGRPPSVGNRERAIGFVDSALRTYEAQAVDLASARGDSIRSRIEQVRSGLEGG